MQFKDVVTDPAQFRELMGEPPPPCVAKTIAIMDRHCRAFIARSPFVLIASASAQAALPMPVEALQEIIKQDETERLY